MRQPPTYTTWKITCRTPADANSLRRWLSSRTDLDRVMVDEVVTTPNGVEQAQTVRHRLGDYFADIRIPHGAASDSRSIRLVFQKRHEAGRFWKDLMVNVLREIEATPEKAAIELEWKGETEPAASVTMAS